MRAGIPSSTSAKTAVVTLGAVASKTLTTSGRAMIEALIAGQRDPQVLAGMAKTRMRPKIPS
jgi:transposase